jgi:hypothetical protein
MLNHNLAQVLLERSIIKAETEVDALYTSMDIDGITTRKSSGTFMVRRAYKSETGLISFELASIRDGSRVRVLADDIIKIDGMAPERIAAVYNIRGDGSKQNVGKKRGRKPKVRTAEELERMSRPIKRKGPRIRKVKNDI